MASGVIEFTPDGVLQGKIDWSSSSNGSSENSSNVTASLYARRIDEYGPTTGQSWSGYININGQAQNNIDFDSSVSVGSDWVKMAEVSTVVSHNNDGTKSISLTGSVTGPSGTSLSSRTSSGGATVNLDKINRYAYIQSLNVQSRTINSITLNYTVDRNAWLFVRINDGDWLNEGEPFASNTTSGSFTIYYKNRQNTERLDPNTQYKIQVLCRADGRDGGLDTLSEITTSTLDIARLDNIANVNIGEEQTITWTNNSGQTPKLKLCKTDNTTIIDYGEVTDTSKKVTPTASTIYALTPESNTYTARYVLEIIKDNITYRNYKDFNFLVTNSNPTFSNFTYENINNTVYNGNKKLNDLTGNNQIIVKNFSNIRATITDANKAVARNSATMKNYSLTIGNKTANNSTISYPLTLEVNAVDGNNIIVAAVDSRGNSTPVTKTATYKEYVDLILNYLTAHRSNNGVGKIVTIDFSGTLWNENFGAINNTIVSATFKYKKTTESSWSQEYSVSPTIDGNNYTASITPNIEFDESSSYNILVTVKDYLETKQLQTTIGAGTPAIAIYKDNVAIGQKYNTSIGGKLQVNGDIKATGKLYQEGKEIWELIYPVGSIYMSVNNTNPGTLFGGTWQAWGSGKVPVGIDTSDEDFETVEKTGGSKSTNLMYRPTSGYGLAPSSPAFSDRYVVGKSNLSQATFDKGNLPPYITCYMWKRVS